MAGSSNPSLDPRFVEAVERELGEEGLAILANFRSERRVPWERLCEFSRDVGDLLHAGRSLWDAADAVCQADARRSPADRRYMHQVPVPATCADNVPDTGLCFLSEVVVKKLASVPIGPDDVGAVVPLRWGPGCRSDTTSVSTEIWITFDGDRTPSQMGARELQL